MLTLKKIARCPLVRLHAAAAGDVVFHRGPKTTTASPTAQPARTAAAAASRTARATTTTSSAAAAAAAFVSEPAHDHDHDGDHDGDSARGRLAAPACVVPLPAPAPATTAAVSPPGAARQRGDRFRAIIYNSFVTLTAVVVVVVECVQCSRPRLAPCAVRLVRGLVRVLLVGRCTQSNAAALRWFSAKAGGGRRNHC